MKSKPNFLSNPINNKYKLKIKLKQGGFGSVYLAQNITNDHKQYAVKIIDMGAKRYAEMEYRLYELIEKQHFTNGFIKYYESGEHLDKKYLVMQLIGQDLQQLKKRGEGGRLSIKTVLMIGLQVVDRLQALHKIGYIHRDVKPDNLAIGLQQKNKIIYLFDFGLAHRIGESVHKEEKGKVIGTLGFMSCRMHEGKEQGPADDLQSLIYTMLYLADGNLPWLKLQIKSPADFHKILLQKKGINKKLFKNEEIPSELFQILTMLKASKVGEKMDYLKIKYKMLDAIKKMGEGNDFAFDWCGSISRVKEPLSSIKKRNESPQLSPRNNKKLQKMNEENQQLVQNQIYEVYKFMEKNQPKKKQSPLKQKKQKSPLKQLKKQKKPSPQKNQVNRIRPASAVNKAKREPDKNQQLLKMMEYMQQTVSGPKIVINRTAKHKI